MSRKHLSVFVGLLLSTPLLALAAYNDVSFTTSARFSVNGVTISVTGSSDVVQSLVVRSGSFDVIMLPGSTLSASASGSVIFNLTVPSPVTNSTACDTGTSTLALSASQSTSATTVTVTPSSVSSCSSSSSSTTTSGNGSPGGGGGGSAPAAIVPQTTTTVTPAVAAVVHASSVAKFVSPAFNRVISVGSKGSDVKTLQQILNSDPDTRVAVKGAGSPGNETTLAGSLTVRAIQKFQLKYGIVKRAGEAGYGTLGPKTRAKLNEIYMKQGGGASSIAPSTPAVTTGATSAQAAQLKALQDALANLRALQSKMKGY